ncbi:hypothetical protein CC78DRAFT_585769 [Lojkania enalia]|uniref:SET domain-containing protein n=1 Tax=Lojkania enalia TaxID=147567 RepID=A0A9P4MZK6_9PLEO|nr:hypothetical protein CC78DRAFT_585769 [Didymosphaeria enalia]
MRSVRECGGDYLMEVENKDNDAHGRWRTSYCNNHYEHDSGCRGKRTESIIIDAKRYGNWTRFINCWCEPYATFAVKRVAGTRIMAVEAVRDVPGEADSCEEVVLWDEVEEELSGVAGEPLARPMIASRISSFRASFGRHDIWLSLPTTLLRVRQEMAVRVFSIASHTTAHDYNTAVSEKTMTPPPGKASRISSAVLSDRTIPTAMGSVKQVSSLGRHLTELQTAQPSISLVPITMPPKPLPNCAMRRLGLLRGKIDNALKGGYIPGGLREAIEQDPDLRLSLSVEPINEEAFG